MNPRIAALFALALLCACATTKTDDAKKPDDQAKSDVKIYSPAELKQGDYETVKRIWVESWRTAFGVPTYSSKDDGIAALKDKASSLDANGLINVDCYGDSGLFGGSVAYTCYGKAIKVSK
jgi:hypothetical protein